jgi:hypothetical protein
MSEADESLSFMATRFRDRAEEARTMAGTMADGFHEPEARRMMAATVNSALRRATRF